ncbi:hypothetical protein HAZT_HAZT001831 [Hyalella azteca]|uniref:CRAL-TRIO domain-containing protein n=1 Tax=Hyalella azteca TaxID=294128 RepID=A0A6A0GW43_HYAAZ|nr:hypothetical protein HAZT_HAZT001831 [Hyalella azteca]
MNHQFNKGPGAPQRQFSAGRQGGFPANHLEDPLPSLSDFHDYEPNLEFDDTELHAVPPVTGDMPDLVQISQDYQESPVSDGTIEENFEMELGEEAEDELGKKPDKTLQHSPPVPQDFSDIAKHGIVDIVGDDPYGRKVVVVSACKLPSNKTFDHAKFLAYLMHTLDQYVEQDYSLVYFHFGLNRNNKPPFSWLWSVYKLLDRKYKKNLKALYLVHPTNFIRVVYNIFKPAISAKFGRKLLYVNYLQELQQHIDLKQLPIPACVKEHDALLVSKLRAPLRAPQVSSKEVSPRHQFGGVSLQFIKNNNDQDPIPSILKQCITYLDHPDGEASLLLFVPCLPSQASQAMLSLLLSM